MTKLKSFKEFVNEGVFDTGTKIKVKDAKHAVNWINKRLKKEGSNNVASMRSKTEVEFTDKVAGIDVDIVDSYLDDNGGEYTSM